MSCIADVKVSLYSSQVDITGSSVCSLPLWVVKLKTRTNVTKLFFQKFMWCVCSRTVKRTMHHLFTIWWITHYLLTRSLYVTSQFRASTNKMVFWGVVKTHIECDPDESAMIHHLGWRVQNMENPIFTSIMCIGVSTPPPSFFCQVPPLICKLSKPPFLGNSPLWIAFSWTPPWRWNHNIKP